MSPDEFQDAWQAHSQKPRITIDADLLLNEVQRSQDYFRKMILLRDYREAGVSIVMIPVWFIMGITLSLPWTWYLMVPGLLFLIGFIVLDRRRHPQRPSDPAAPLIDSVQESLRQVEHQIWLLRNVLWWYLMPFAIPILIFWAHSAWIISGGRWILAIGIAIPFFVFLFVLYGFIYYINQRAVRKQLIPRRQELVNLLNNLSDEPVLAVPAEYPVLKDVKNITCSPRRMIFAAIAFLAILLIGVPAILYGAVRLGSGADNNYPKLSPFAAVRWDGEQPEVQLDDVWFKLVSVNGIPATEIVAYSQATFPTKWQKRFEEDIVEVLTRMGHKPGTKADLVVQSLDAGDTRTLEDVPMSAANRKAIRDAAQMREGYELKPLSQVVPDLRREHNLVGLAAMVMIDGEIVDSAVDGERKKGSGVPLTIDDQWHMGSITKSITATMIARLVESGRMRWDDTVGQAFPDAAIHANWKPVTVEQLLKHRSGAPANFSLSVRMNNPSLGPEAAEARREAVLAVMAGKPEHAPGTTMLYSNVGYSIAGAMAEAATGEAWSELVRREVFEPLELTGAGFGPPKSPDKTFDQPRGHRVLLGRKLAMSDTDDNTTIMAPSGLVHMTLKDLCTYANEHLRGERGEGKLLSAESYQRLHSPEDRYACGWVYFENGPGIPPPVYWHNGSNTMWYAAVVFIPDANTVVAVTSNDGDIKNAEAAAWKVITNSVAQTISGTGSTPDAAHKAHAAPGESPI